MVCLINLSEAPFTVELQLEAVRQLHLIAVAIALNLADRLVWVFPAHILENLARHNRVGHLSVVVFYLFPRTIVAKFNWGNKISREKTPCTSSEINLNSFSGGAKDCSYLRAAIFHTSHQTQHIYGNTFLFSPLGGGVGISLCLHLLPPNAERE